MATSPMRPIRLRILDQEGVANYPNELLSDFDNKKLALYDADHNKMIEFFADLNTEVTGDGNAITEMSVSGNKITAVKTETFLTKHPDVATSVDTTSTQAGGFGDTVTIVDSVVRDTDGHVIKINFKTLTLPTETELSVNSTGTGNAVTGIKVSDHGITMEKNANFLTQHPTVAVIDDTTSAVSPAEGASFTVIDNVTRDGNGHVTNVNTKTVTLPKHQDTTISKGTATGTGNAVTDINVADGVITPVKGATFLTEHPDISQNIDSTSDTGANFGDVFTVVDSVTRDSNGHVTKISTNTISLPDETVLSKESSGTGNAVTDVAVSGHKVTVTKGATFLTEHPVVTKSTDSTSVATPEAGDSFTVVDSVTRDDNGHVTKVNTKTVTLPESPEETPVAVTVTGSGNAVTAASADGHNVTLTKGATFLTQHPAVSTTGGTATKSLTHGGTFEYVSSITKDANGHVTDMTLTTGTMPSVQTDVSGNAATASKLKTPISINVSGAVTGSASNVDGSSNVNITTTSVDAAKLSGVIPIENIPQGALERLVIVDDDTARLALTSSDVQNGDVVKVSATGLMYFIKDETKLGTEDAFESFTAGTASSVAWSGITNKPTFAAVATSGSYNDLSDAPSVSVTSEGTGNAVTAIAQNGHGIKITKGATFLTQHPTIAQSIDSTSDTGADFGDVFTVVDSITRDSNGHVTKISTNTISLPDETTLSKGTTSGSGNAVTDISVSGHTVTLTKGASFALSSHTHSAATTSEAGLMSAVDKAKLDGIDEGANKITVDSALSSSSTNPVQNKVINTALAGKSDTSHTHNYAGSSSSGGAANSVVSSLIVKLNGGTVEGTSMFTFNGSAAKSINITPSGIGAAASSHTHDDQYYTEAEVDTKLATKSDTSHTHATATTSTAGLMSATDKAKLDSIAEDATKVTIDSALSSTSTNPVQNKVINTALVGKSDTSHTHDERYYTESEVDTKLATKSDTSHTHSAATSSAAGLMSAMDKAKLDGIASGANATTIDSALSSTSTNPVQNKVINTALAGKSDTSHTHDELYYTETEVDTKLATKSDTSHTHNYAGSSSAGGAATSANKVNSSIIVKLNGGTTEGTNMFTFDGSTAKTVDIAPSTIGAAATSHNHDDTYYTETEVDTKLAGKSDTSHTHSVATTSAAGLMSAADKTKLDGLGDMTVDSALSSTSTNPVQNKVVNSAISAKASTTLYSATIPTSGWTGSAAPYTVSIAVSGMLATDTPIVDVDLSSTDYDAKSDVITAYSNIYRITTGANYIMAFADEIPSVAVPIQLKVVR